MVLYSKLCLNDLKCGLLSKNIYRRSRAESLLGSGARPASMVVSHPSFPFDAASLWHCLLFALQFSALADMNEPLNLLALGAPSRTSMIFHTNLLTDGGGIRGVSMLLILDEVMKRIQHDKRLANPPRPCEYFHLIGGTGTGGYVGPIDHAENICSAN